MSAKTGLIIRILNSHAWLVGWDNCPQVTILKVANKTSEVDKNLDFDRKYLKDVSRKWSEETGQERLGGGGCQWRPKWTSAFAYNSLAHILSTSTLPRSCLHSHFSLSIDTCFSVPAHACSFLKAQIKCHLFCFLQLSMLEGEGLQFSFICDLSVFIAQS
jgi:hypothetical protein